MKSTTEASDWLPPLQCLRAFTAVCRTGSITQAAKDLSLTNSAVSHHLSQLEAWLGLSLFTRHRRGVTPTDPAKLLAGEIEGGLTQLRAALAKMRTQPTPSLTLTLLPALAQRWLLPQLGELAAQVPDLDLRLVPTAQIMDLQASGIDLALRYGPGGWPGVTEHFLGHEWLFPVARPGFAGGYMTPHAISKAPLIRNPSQLWQPWFKAAGLSDLPEPDRGIIIHDAGMALDLALQGKGIALARSRLVAAELARGQLVRLSPVAVQDSYSYYAVSQGSGHPALGTLIAWLREAFVMKELAA